MDKKAKEYDSKNLLKEKSGYNSQKILSCMSVSSQSELNYALKLFDNLYNSKEKYIDNLISELTKNILNIDKTVKKVKSRRRIKFKANRNFAILEVEDSKIELTIVGRTNYEPLCRSFKFITLEDISMYTDYIKNSFELTKVKVID